MHRDPQAERWYEGKPAEPALRRVREVILRADRRMAEATKYGTVTFHCGGDFASFVQHDKNTVSLMFNRGGIIPGQYAHMEGEGRQVRFMRFADVKEVDARRAELSTIVVAWCDLMSPKAAASRTK